MGSISALGPLRVESPEGKRRVGGPRQQAVAAVLLVNRGQPIRTERLIDEVWGESPPVSVRSSLQSYVSNLRRAFAGLARIDSTSNSYTILLQPGVFDLDELARTIQQAADLLSEGDLTGASLRYGQAVAAFGAGTAFDGVDTPSVQQERSRLDELRMGTGRSGTSPPLISATDTVRRHFRLTAR